MKKLTGIFVLVLALFSMFYYSNTALANKAVIPVSPAKQTIDVSLGIGASFTISGLDGASSVSILVKPVSSGSYQTVTGLGNLTSANTYTRTALQMQTQFGNGSFYWKVVDDFNPSHESAVKELEIQD